MVTAATCPAGQASTFQALARLWCLVLVFQDPLSYPDTSKPPTRRAARNFHISSVLPVLQGLEEAGNQPRAGHGDAT